MAPSSGYSGTPLANKLGIKPGFRIRVINAPDHYFDLFESFPENVSVLRSRSRDIHLIHFFTRAAAELESHLPKLKGEIVPDGIIWISWPKKASGMKTDVSESTVRDAALRHGLVDVKVCAVDEVRSGLKLVIPVVDRVQRVR